LRDKNKRMPKKNFSFGILAVLIKYDKPNKKMNAHRA
jgi:hypothetical protein